VELVVLAPLLLAFAMLAVVAGRMTTARMDVAQAARQAARAASLERDPAAAERAARRTATEALAGQRVTCARLDLTVDIGRLRPGGSVTVRVACTQTLSDLTGLALPATAETSASFTSPVDTYRGDLP
jgi:Flp pilus assembly protein TadG